MNVKKTHAHTHHLVRSLLIALKAEDLRVSEACGIAGVHRSSVSKWVHHGAKADLVTLEALGEVAGLQLVWRPLDTHASR